MVGGFHSIEDGESLNFFDVLPRAFTQGFCSRAARTPFLLVPFPVLDAS